MDKVDVGKAAQNQPNHEEQGQACPKGQKGAARGNLGRAAGLAAMTVTQDEMKSKGTHGQGLTGRRVRVGVGVGVAVRRGVTVSVGVRLGRGVQVEVCRRLRCS